VDRVLLAGILKNIQGAVDPRNFLQIPKEIGRYVKDWQKFHTSSDRQLNVKKLPIFFENNNTSVFDPHYVLQAYWATKQLSKGNQQASLHIDISSHIQFIAQLSAIIPVVQLEYRPPDINLDNLNHISGNLLQLPFADNSVLSMTCLHAIEHIGLGRYGDPIDKEGCWHALSELKRVTAKGGRLLISVPVGKSTTYFNAGYVFKAQDIVDFFFGFKLSDYSYVDDAGKYFERGNLDSTDGMRCALGLYHFINP
jgi:hypothetical protein